MPTVDEKIIEQLEEIFRYSDVIVCYLYGSYSRNQQTNLSDLDLAVLMNNNSNPLERQYISLVLSSAIGTLLKGIEVDLRVLNDTSLEYSYNVIKDGKVIYCENDRERIDFESRLIMEYLDFKPLIVQYNQYMYRRIEETGKI